MPEETSARFSTAGKVGVIIALFIAIIIALVLLIQVQMNILIAVRAYIAGEGMWAKSQKDACRSLEHYAMFRKEDDYKSYLRFIQVPLGDSKSRIELQKPNPNLDIARDGFLMGGNHPEDIDYMIDFFVRFHNITYMTEAITYWTKGDQYIAELNSEAKKLHEENSSGVYTPEAVGALLARLDLINQHLTEQENLFSFTLAKAARWVNDVSRKTTYGIASLFALLGIGISWPFVTNIRSIEDKLIRSRNDLRIAATAFESQESLMITDAEGVIMRVNKAFTDCTGYLAEDVLGQTPRILKSGRHDDAFYGSMWQSIRHTGTWQGEVWDRRKNGEIYPKWLSISAVKGNDGVVTNYVGSHVDITERKAAEEQIQQLAFHDTLTNLPNRQLLLDRMRQALVANARSSRHGAVLFVDLDNFKTINDTLGHLEGDLLLQQVAERLTSCVRGSDTVARLGGDEFVVMLEDLSEQPLEAAEQTKVVGEKILIALSQPYQLRTKSLHSSGSIGATLFDGNIQETEELLKQADIAMYQAKKAGRNDLRFFDPQMQDAINIRAELESELHKALDNQQFQLYYQIQVDSSGRALGAEALIRWSHPMRGIVSPIHFIPLAEETGLILPIGKWVLETACSQLKAWADDEKTKNLILAVNISARQFHQDNFVDQVRKAVQDNSVNPNLLKLELTESLLLDHIEQTVASMNALKAAGVQLSLDDFGTGYSSLQYLKLLPLNQIKIDRSFVMDIVTDQNDAAIVQTIIAIAEMLGLDVIAEGIETVAQHEFLDLRGCRAYQGYLFGKPVPIEQFDASIRNAYLSTPG